MQISLVTVERGWSFDTISFVKLINHPTNVHFQTNQRLFTKLKKLIVKSVVQFAPP